MRTERDTLGEVQVPMTRSMERRRRRAVENYPVSGLREHPLFIRAFVLLKKAAALANKELGALDAARASAIIGGCDALLDTKSNTAGSSWSMSSRPAPVRRST